MLDLEYLKKNPWQKFLYRAERFFRNIPSGFVSFFKKLWSVICGFGMKIAAAFQEVYRAAKDGDWKTRTSFVVMGFGHFARRQYLRGAMYLIFEVIFIAYFALFGWKYLVKMGSLGDQAMVEVFNEETGIFEYVYFARTDSVIDGLSVYNARIAMGRQLAKEYPVDADMVCGVPDSGLEAAMGYAQQSGLPYQLGFVKNRYIGRSFIFPSQQQRDAAVRLKLNPLSVNLKGKRVVLVDDSIVRGTTSAKIIKSLKQAGASEVHLRISSPPFKHTCHFGTDIDSEENLIANQLELDAICRQIGADSLGFISIDGLKQACEGCGLSFCTGCFTGEYPVDIGSSHTKAQFEDISSGGTGQF